MSRDMSALVGVVGDFNPKNPTHRFTNEALDHVWLHFEWVPTDAIEDEPEKRLAAYHGIWIAPASPNRSSARSGRSATHGNGEFPSSVREAASSTRSSSSRATFSGSETPTTPRRRPVPGG